MAQVDFPSLYQSELSYLREVGREFATSHPSLSALFAETGDDPDVQRLLEGFAFLSAQIRQRAEDAVPEFIESLGEVVLPHYARTTPACSIVEFRPKPGRVRGVHVIPEGAPLGAKLDGGAMCRFQTTQKLALLPLVLQRTVLDTRSANKPELRFRLQLPEHAGSALAEHGSLRVFIHGSWGLSSSLLYWFSRHLEGISLVGEDGYEVTLDERETASLPYERDPALWPWPRSSVTAPRLLLELFTFPQRFAFVEIQGLDRVCPDRLGRSAEIVARFSQPPALPEMPTEHSFRLHCVPAVNLFRTTADPVRWEPTKRRALVRAAGCDPNQAEVFSIDGVEGIDGDTGRRSTLKNFTSFSHLSAIGSEHSTLCYTTSRSHSVVDGGIDTFISVSRPRATNPSSGSANVGEMNLSVDLTCTNRQLPTNLRVGDICRSVPGAPTVATFENIVPVSRPVPPSLGTELKWRLIGHLGLSHHTLSNASVLQKLLRLYNFQRSIDHQAAVANDRRIDGIRGSETARMQQITRGGLVRGNQTTIEIEQAHVAGIGDAFIFGCCLDSFLALHAPINATHKLRMRIHPSMEELSWAPRAGQQKIM